VASNLPVNSVAQLDNAALLRLNLELPGCVLASELGAIDDEVLANASEVAWGDEEGNNRVAVDTVVVEVVDGGGLGGGGDASKEGGDGNELHVGGWIGFGLEAKVLELDEIM
jgi:hypothetical protein